MVTTRLSLIAACVCFVLTGCAHYDLRKGIPWKKGEDGELERPMKIVAVWTDTVMSKGEHAPVRGFGGNILFYAREDSKPVKVKGQLSVYAFDETNRDPRNVRPEKKYVFTEEELEKHHSENKVGHAYSIWLPWDKVGGPQTEISLLVRFTPKAGGTIMGEQQTTMLPGTVVGNIAASKPGSKPTSPAGAHLPVQQTSYTAAPPTAAMGANSAVSGTLPAQSNVIVAGQESGQMTTTTIPISGAPGNRFPISTGAANTPGVTTSSGNNAPRTSVINSQEPLAWAQPSGSAGQSSAHFGPGRHRPLGAPIARLDRDHGPWRPSHVAPPSAAGAIHQSAPRP